MKKISSLYIHIPYCLSKCKYCDFFSKPENNVDNSQIIRDEYITALCNEISYRFNKYNCNLIETIYIGGGTPSLLTESQLNKIIESIKKNIQFENISEFTIEANPDDLSESKLNEYLNLGITRISVGIQSLSDDVLKFCGRRADRNTNSKALQLLKQNWPRQVSIDLICGLPGETKESFNLGLKECIKYNPDHISMYSLTFEDETPFGQMLENGTLEYDFDYADELWLEGKEVLDKACYEQYEVSNFAKSNQHCLHNLTYWKHQNYIGVGCGATGTVYPFRWTNKQNINNYISYWTNSFKNDCIPQIEEQIERTTEKFEFFMMGLRKLTGVTCYEYYSFFNEKIPETVLKTFNRWNKNQLMDITFEKDDVRYALNKKGILFLNKLLEEIEV